MQAMTANAGNAAQVPKRMTAICKRNARKRSTGAQAYDSHLDMNSAGAEALSRTVQVPKRMTAIWTRNAAQVPKRMTAIWKRTV